MNRIEKLQLQTSHNTTVSGKNSHCMHSLGKFCDWTRRILFNTDKCILRTNAYGTFLNTVHELLLHSDYVFIHSMHLIPATSLVASFLRLSLLKSVKDVSSRVSLMKTSTAANHSCLTRTRMFKDYCPHAKWC